MTWSQNCAVYHSVEIFTWQIQAITQNISLGVSHSLFQFLLHFMLFCLSTQSPLEQQIADFGLTSLLLFEATTSLHHTYISLSNVETKLMSKVLSWMPKA